MLIKIRERIINTNNIQYTYLDKYDWYKSCYQPTVVIDFANDISIKINIENRDIDEYRCFERKLLLATI